MSFAFLLTACGPTDSGYTRNDTSLDSGADTHSEVPRVWKDLDADGITTCGIDSAGSVECWADGGGGAGDLAAVPSGTFESVSVSNDWGCALDDSSNLQCWGREYGSRLADAPSGAFAQVDVGWEFGCVLDSDGTLGCWGSEQHLADMPRTGSYSKLSASFNHACVLDDAGVVQCWGSTDDLQEDVPDGPFVDVSVGSVVACALASNGNVTCWGNPTLDPPSASFGLLSCGGTYPSCAGIDEAGALHFWDDEPGNYRGLDDVPVGTFVDVATGQGFGCALNDGGAIECWGEEAPDAPG